MVPLRVGESQNLWMVPNSVASRSAITQTAFFRLQNAGLIGANIVDFPTGRKSCVLNNARVLGQQVPDLHVRIRDVDEFLVADGEYVADGYLGMDYLFGAFTSIAIDTQTLQVKLGLRPSSATT